MSWRVLAMMAVVALAVGAQAAEPAAEVEAAAAPEPPPPGPKELPFTKANVLAVVALHAEELQACYEEAMARRGSTSKDAPAGKVLMGWTITPQGVPADVKVLKSEIQDRLVTDCMADSIRRWEFPRPDRPQPIEFPFELKAIGATKTMVGERAREVRAMDRNKGSR